MLQSFYLSRRGYPLSKNTELRLPSTDRWRTDYNTLFSIPSTTLKETSKLFFFLFLFIFMLKLDKPFSDKKIFKNLYFSTVEICVLKPNLLNSYLVDMAFGSAYFCGSVSRKPKFCESNGSIPTIQILSSAILTKW